MPQAAPSSWLLRGWSWSGASACFLVARCLNPLRRLGVVGAVGLKLEGGVCPDLTSLAGKLGPQVLTDETRGFLKLCLIKAVSRFEPVSCKHYALSTLLKTGFPSGDLPLQRALSVASAGFLSHQVLCR